MKNLIKLNFSNQKSRQQKQDLGCGPRGSRTPSSEVDNPAPGIRPDSALMSTNVLYQLFLKEKAPERALGSRIVPIVAGLSTYAHYTSTTHRCQAPQSTMKLWQKSLSSFLIFAILLPSLLIPAAILVVPQKAQALVPIVKPPTACFILDIECIKENFLDVALKAASNAILRAMTNSVVSWIQGGGGNFIQNLTGELQRQLDLTLGEFLNRLAGINMCGNIGAYLQIALRSPGSRAFSQKYSCTISNIVSNLQNFFTNFQNGGWPAWFHLSVTPTADPAGALIFAIDDKLRLGGEVKDSLINNFLAGKGFLGIQECQQVPDGDYNLETGEPTYYKQCKTTTPGATVARALEKAAVDTPFEQLVNVHEIQEMVNAILNALIQKVMTGIF